MVLKIQYLWYDECFSVFHWTAIISLLILFRKTHWSLRKLMFLVLYYIPMIWKFRGRQRKCILHSFIFTKKLPWKNALILLWIMQQSEELTSFLYSKKDLNFGSHVLRTILKCRLQILMHMLNCMAWNLCNIYAFVGFVLGSIFFG